MGNGGRTDPLAGRKQRPFACRGIALPDDNTAEQPEIGVPLCTSRGSSLAPGAPKNDVVRWMHGQGAADFGNGRDIWLLFKRPVARHAKQKRPLRAPLEAPVGQRHLAQSWMSPRKPGLKLSNIGAFRVTQIRSYS